MEDAYQTWRSQGVEAGLKRFEAVIGMEGTPPEQPPGPPTPRCWRRGGRISGNLEYFLAHGIRQISGHAPDVDALRAGPARSPRRCTGSWWAEPGSTAPSPCDTMRESASANARRCDTMSDRCTYL
jgi:hypothetical protein